MAKEWKQELAKTFEFEVERLTITECRVAKLLGVDLGDFVVAKIRRAMNAYQGDQVFFTVKEMLGEPTPGNATIGADYVELIEEPQ